MQNRANSFIINSVLNIWVEEPFNIDGMFTVKKSLVSHSEISSFYCLEVDKMLFEYRYIKSGGYH